MPTNDPTYQIIDTGKCRVVRAAAGPNATIVVAARLTGQPERLIEVALEFNTPLQPITRIPPRTGASDATGVKIVRKQGRTA